MLLYSKQIAIASVTVSNAESVLRCCQINIIVLFKALLNLAYNLQNLVND